MIDEEKYWEEKEKEIIEFTINTPYFKKLLKKKMQNNNFKFKVKILIEENVNIVKKTGNKREQLYSGKFIKRYTHAQLPPSLFEVECELIGYKKLSEKTYAVQIKIHPIITLDIDNLISKTFNNRTKEKYKYKSSTEFTGPIDELDNIVFTDSNKNSKIIVERITEAIPVYTFSVDTSIILQMGDGV